jgi:hypothetical protein
MDNSQKIRISQFSTSRRACAEFRERLTDKGMAVHPNPTSFATIPRQ